MSAKIEVPFGRGPGPAFGAMEALGFVNALSCYMCLIFKHSDTNWDKKNN